MLLVNTGVIHTSTALLRRQSLKYPASQLGFRSLTLNAVAYFECADVTLVMKVKTLSLVRTECAPFE